MAWYSIITDTGQNTSQKVFFDGIATKKEAEYLFRQAYNNENYTRVFLFKGKNIGRLQQIEEKGVIL